MHPRSNPSDQPGKSTGQRWLTRGLLLASIILATLIVPVGAASAASPEKCTSEEYVADRNGIAGNRFYSFHMKVRWCYNGDKVTSVEQPEIWSSVTTAGRAVGWVYNPDQSAVSPKETLTDWTPEWGYKLRGRGTYTNCVHPDVPCLVERHPEITIDVFGDGAHYATHKSNGGR